MKKIIIFFLLGLNLNVFANDCDELKEEIIFYVKKNITSAHTNEYLKRLETCGLSKYEVLTLQNFSVFATAIEKIKSDYERDIKVKDILEYVTANKQLFTFTEENKKLMDFYLSDLTKENYEEVVRKVSNAVDETTLEMFKKHIENSNVFAEKKQIRLVLHEFYLQNFNIDDLYPNFNSISWKSSSEVKEAKIDKSMYADRIQITATKTNSHIILNINLKEDWNIYSLNSSTENMFKSDINPINGCLKIQGEIEVDKLEIKKDPLNASSEAEFISGNRIIKIPYTSTCKTPLQLEFIFTLVNSQGTMLPFLSETIMIE
ncbi:hypothetical protein [Aureivirga sp. CE67]|uniref:hypothetical protein n=1 Tax=Aureivirga sp. CE67 TaxID=1788983 RepID=UPI0018CBD0EC|nr:hypothetical protein [Aureivirga sp. CE67]